LELPVNRGGAGVRAGVEEEVDLDELLDPPPFLLSYSAEVISKSFVSQLGFSVR
jgi:hypothetical protein